jgi:hypothetical protein
MRFRIHRSKMYDGVRVGFPFAIRLAEVARGATMGSEQTGNG